MPDLNDIHTIIAEVGPLDEEIEAVARIADDRWVIQYEPLAIVLEHDAGGNRLMLTGEIGPVPDDRRDELLPAMLSYGLLWRETGGLRIALVNLDDTALLMVDLAGDQIEARTIARVAINLAERTLLWRAVFAAEAPVPVPEDVHFESPHFIRV